MAAAAGLGAAAAMPAAAVMSTTGVAAEGENLCAHIEELAGAQHGQSPRAMSKLVRPFAQPSPRRHILRSRPWPEPVVSGRSPPAVTQPLRTARTGARARKTPGQSEPQSQIAQRLCVGCAQEFKMEGIRKRMMRANALNASNQREAYHAEMRLIQQVISPPFLFLLTADVSSGNRRKCSANPSVPNTRS